MGRSSLFPKGVCDQGYRRLGSGTLSMSCRSREQRVSSLTFPRWGGKLRMLIGIITSRN